jgi:purine-binding chemotaxis protein CheW
MRPLAVEPVSGVPAFVRGLAVIRGEPVPVVDAASLLGGDPPEGSSGAGRFISLETAGRRLALAVDEVLGLADLDASSLAGWPSLLGEAQGRAVEWISCRGETLLLVLSCARLVPEEAWEALARAGAGRGEGPKAS